MLNEFDITKKNDSDITSIGELIRNDYSYFSTLSSELRNNPYLLNIALTSFNGGKNSINPISYALEKALTKENIDLALEKGGNINIYGLLRENELFHKINIEKGVIPVAYSLLPNFIKEDDYLMSLYMRICPDEYKNLDVRQRNNPEILKQALDNELGKNPISYALEGALTDENVDLALEKGNIIIVKDSPLSNCKHLVLKLFKDSHNVFQYVFLSDKLKSDPEILKQALLNYDSKIVKVNPISYALEGALTDENMDLALKLGNVKIIKGASISDSKYFIIEVFKRGLYISHYKDISDKLKSDPEILKQALLNYDSKIVKVNPISYALEGALTKENVDLTLKKGNIEFMLNNSLLSNRYFVIKSFKNGLFFSQYNNISDTLKNDPEVRALIPSELEKMYKYDCAVIGILPDGKALEREVRGKSDKGDHHKGTIIKMIDEFCEKYENDSYLCALRNDLSGVSNSFKAAQLCANYDVLAVLIVEHICMLFCPDVLSIEQLQTLQNFLNKYSDYFECELYHGGEIFRKNVSQENGESDRFSVDETIDLIDTNDWVNRVRSYR